MQDDEFNNVIDFDMWSQTPIFNAKDQLSGKSILSNNISGQISVKTNTTNIQNYDIKQTNNTESKTTYSVADTTKQVSSIEKPSLYVYSNQQNSLSSLQYTYKQSNNNNVYYQQFESASQNRYSFVRSYKYFLQLITGKIDESVFSLNADTVVDPMRYNRKQTNVSKGLFCSNRECCSLILDILGRSPYCCKQCQIREQNMRQTRVKSRESVIRRKQALFTYLLRLKDDDFERARIVGIVGTFLKEYGEEFGEL